ncbi:hypothetical protein AUJ84_00965 [Candidatus Pacearchaeota archaeon CG1_02_32_132]|nr:MAG: hypothetical protein AUJ84_00965 [Candidatus Pacearchaeota archaeon CG1_02_32_132]
MTIFDEIRQMQSQGLVKDQMRDNLKAKGFSNKEVDEAMSQNEMKGAVEQEAEFPVSQEENQRRYESGGMVKSILPPEAEDNGGEMQQNQEYIPQAPQPQGIQEYSPQYPKESAPQAPQGYEEYQPYQSYSSGPSPDLITEISEQVLSEKLSPLRKSLEKTMELKNVLGSKIDYMEERLKRIEKTIDILQSSVLRKVGDYITDVQDIKAELIETQKSLSKVFPEISKSTVHHSTHPAHHPHKKHNKKE